MTNSFTITRVGPLVTVQDAGRPGLLQHGVCASGPMDLDGWNEAISFWEEGVGASSGIEFTTSGLDFVVESGHFFVGFGGGQFNLTLNGEAQIWPTRLELSVGDKVSIKPGAAGNYGYMRCDGDVDVPQVMGSRATNMIAGLGGLEGRALAAGDTLTLLPAQDVPASSTLRPMVANGTDIRVIWGIHADLFPTDVREKFLNSVFTISPQMDRMAVRLKDQSGVFAGDKLLSLVSDSVVTGDIQILGDGTPIVLMRDHQPTGGYPRIATIISADISRFAQMRPGSKVYFRAVTISRAQKLAKRNASK